MFAIRSIQLTLSVLAKMAIGKDDRKRIPLFQSEPFTRKARIAARASNEMRLLMPLQAMPMVKLAAGISIWFPVIMTGTPNKNSAHIPMVQQDIF